MHARRATRCVGHAASSKKICFDCRRIDDTASGQRVASSAARRIRLSQEFITCDCFGATSPSLRRIAMKFKSKLFLLSSFSLAALSVGNNSAYAQACESLSSLDIPYATITAAQSIPAGSFQPPTGALITNLPAFCRVALTMMPSSDSSIRVEVWMPASTWTGRFQGTGGGGYTGSVNYGVLGTGVRAGNATANTDMGTAP